MSVKPRTEPTIIALPCAKLTVLDTVQVIWKPSAIRPYMAPSPSPVTIAEVRSILHPFKWGLSTSRAGNK